MDIFNPNLADFFSVGIAVLVSALAIWLIFSNARKIGGGALAKVYRYFGWGMLFNLAGFLVTIFPEKITWLPAMRLHDFLFIAGYTAMAVGAKKILDAAGLR